MVKIILVSIKYKDKKGIEFDIFEEKESEINGKNQQNSTNINWEVGI